MAKVWGNVFAMRGKSEKGHVLVVDDEEAICQLLTDGLREEGFDCQSCTSGEEALRLLQEQNFDIVITDVRMPGISGLELLEKGIKEHPHAAYVMATGLDDVRVGVEAMKRGAADYLVKPFNLHAVVVSLERAVREKRLKLELEKYHQELERLVEQRTREVVTALKRIELTYDETLQALGAALDLRDTETAGHCARVTRYCLEMSRAMGCSGEDLKYIVWGSYLHDIGKIGIPDAVLLKPGKLTEGETIIMQSHARIGYDLVRRIAFLAPAAQIVLTHQERYDGTGYPQGLRGKEIPLGARIFAVADTLDAMTSDRPYRRALPFSTAREEVERQSGLQFDPEVARVFHSLPEERWLNIRAEVDKVGRLIRTDETFQTATVA